VRRSVYVRNLLIREIGGVIPSEGGKAAYRRGRRLDVFTALV
jgi:hypothetical protein